MKPRAMILAPNGGWDLAYGGGTKVALCMANILAALGYEVMMVSLLALPRLQLEKAHNISLDKRVTISCVHTLEKELSHIPFPIGFWLLSRHASQVLSRLKPDIAIFHDDVSKSVLRAAMAHGASTLLCVHFSYKVRALTPMLAISYSEENILQQLPLFAFVRKHFADLDEIDRVIVDSSVTKRLSEQFFPSQDMRIVYPPADLGSPGGAKDRMIFHAGRQDHTFLGDMLIEAQAVLSRSDNPIQTIVNRPSRAFLRRVRKLERTRGTSSAPRLTSAYASILPKCMFYSHFKWFEPFGISCIEAMSYGAIPVIYRSPYNGPWTDVIRQGDFGLGFSSAAEFADLVEGLACDDMKRNCLSTKAVTRSGDFSLQHYISSLSRVLLDTR